MSMVLVFKYQGVLHVKQQNLSRVLLPISFKGLVLAQLGLHNKCFANKCFHKPAPNAILEFNKL